jgi:putative DNA methylase
LETLLEKLFGMPRSGVAGVDPATRFYVLWRFAYRNTAIDAGEAIVFAYPQGVELDGARGVSAGSRALVKKESNNYRLRDFTERGHDDKLGLPQENGSSSLIDVLHRVLWLMENKPRELSDYLMKARPNLDQLRVVAETLAGAKLAGNGKGGGRSLIAATGAEASALKTLTTNWRTVIEANVKPLV